MRVPAHILLLSIGQAIRMNGFSSLTTKASATLERLTLSCRNAESSICTASQSQIWCDSSFQSKSKHYLDMTKACKSNVHVQVQYSIAIKEKVERRHSNSWPFMKVLFIKKPILFCSEAGGAWGNATNIIGTISTRQILGFKWEIVFEKGYNL